MIQQLLLSAVAVGLLTAADKPESDAVKKEMDKLQGYWEVTAAEGAGLDADAKQLKLVFTGDKLAFSKGNKAVHEATYKVDPSQKPRTIDITHVTGPQQGKTFRGIYELEGDQLKICWSGDGEKRSTEFAVKPKTTQALLTLKRGKP